MRAKYRETLRAAALLSGHAGADGEPLPDDVTARHDWRTFLLAKDMYTRGGYTGPDWVPFNLWSIRSGRFEAIVHKLIYAAGASELWKAIQNSYEHPNGISIQLPMEISLALDRWKLTNKRKPADHAEHLLRLKANALALANEVDQIEALDALDTGEKFDFLKLYSEEERGIVVDNVRRHNLSFRNMIAKEVAGRELGYRPDDFIGGLVAKEWKDYNTPEDPEKPESPINRSLASYESGPLFELLLGDEDGWPGIVPNVSATLRRLAAHFDEESLRPPIKRPVFENAERNYFARHLCHYFTQSCGFASPAIVCRVVSMFYPQGITDNEVSQMLKKIRRPLGVAGDSETSPAR